MEGRFHHDDSKKKKKTTTRQQEKPKSIEGWHETRRAPFSVTMFDLYFMSGHAMHQTKMCVFLLPPLAASHQRRISVPFQLAL